MKAGWSVPLLVVLAACAEPESAAPPLAPAMHDSCGASRFQGLVGQPKAVLVPMQLPAGTRIIGPDQAVTMDLRPDRLNIETGRDDRISRIGCY